MQPFVSIVVPCYNEERTIRHLLDAVLGQTYPLGKIEMIISDALSNDRTREVIAGFHRAHPALNVKVLDNQTRTIPSGINQAIRHSSGEIIIRLDAHSVPVPEYIERCVDAHAAGKGLNVGGVWEIRAGGQSWIADSIARAAAHPLGVGDALYRLNTSAGPVDTVPFGSFHRSLIDRIGFFDESLLANEDYEFNTRVRESGGVVWIDPKIKSVYFARSTLAGLASQYWRYGYWKLRMLRRYPYSLRWRQALPPVFVACLMGLIVLCLWFAPARILLAAQVSIYLFILALAGLKQAIEHRSPHLLWGLPLAIMTMHLAWGAGFLWSGIRIPFTNHG